MSQCPGLVLYAILTPVDGRDLEEFADYLVVEYEDGDYELKEDIQLPIGFCIVKVQEDEVDVYQGVNGDTGQVCITRMLANDYCGYVTTDYIFEMRQELIKVCNSLAVQTAQEFTYEIRVGASFG